MAHFDHWQKWRRLGLLFCVAHAAQTASAATDPSWRLSYVVDEGARCPEAALLQQEVTARLGYSPFSDDAGEEFVVDIHRNGRQLSGRMRWVDALGDVLGERIVEEDANNCKTLVETLALAIAVAIDPLQLGSPRKTDPPPKVERHIIEPESQPSLLLDDVDVKTPQSWQFGVRTLASIGPLPSPGLALGLAGSWRIGAASISLGARADWPSDSAIGDVGSLHTRLLLAELAGFVHLDTWRIGPLLQAGALIAEVRGLRNAKQATISDVIAGMRSGFNIPLDATWVVDVSGEVGMPVTPIVLQDLGGGTEFWRSPPVVFALGLGLSMRGELL